MATASAVEAHRLKGIPSRHPWYFAASNRRANSSSAGSSTTLALPEWVRLPIRTATDGSAWRFRTQSDRLPPPDSMNSVSSEPPNQISIVCGRPVRRPVVVR